MRTVKRPRRYVPRLFLLALRPLYRYSAPRDAYVLRAVGRNYGPVIRPDRRAVRRRRRRQFDGVERRRTQTTSQTRTA
jgi:hypothetical protein